MDLKSPSSSLARAAMALGVSAGAGPPVTGSSLKPPSVGGLWDGVTTMPSARPSPSKRWVPSAARLWVRMAWETTGVGTKSSRESTRTCTPLATSTSMAVFLAGPDSAWVSEPRYSGPVTPAFLRYSAMAWEMAMMWASLNEVFRDDPRWPEVPKMTRCSGTSGSGTRS